MIGFFGLTGLTGRLSAQVGLIFLANLVNNGTAFLVNILVAKYFGTEIFGLFSLVTTVAMTTLGLSEFGMNLTMVRFFKRCNEDELGRRAVVLANLCFKMQILAVLVLGGFLFAGTLSQFLANGEAPEILMGVALASGGVLGLWSFTKALLQSLDRFSTIAALTFVYAALRMIFLVGFLAMDGEEAGVGWLFAGLYLMPIGVVLILSWAGLRSLLAWGGVSGRDVWVMLTQSIGYSKWVAAAGIAYILVQKSLVFVVAASTSLHEVALLNAGLVFTAIFSLINDSAQQVLFPKIAELKGEEIGRFKGKIRKILPGYYFLSLVLLVAFSVIMGQVLGETYRQSLPVFWISGIGSALTTGLGFYSLMLHSVNRPDALALINFVTLLGFSAVGFWVASRFGLLAVVAFHALILFSGELAKSAWFDRYAQGNCS